MGSIVARCETCTVPKKSVDLQDHERERTTITSSMHYPETAALFHCSASAVEPAFCADPDLWLLCFTVLLRLVIAGLGLVLRFSVAVDLM